MRLLAPLFYVLYVLLSPLPPPQAQSLKQSDALAKVQDLQGTALVRPVAASRWTPLRQKDLLFVGDLVRTSTWGANAVELRLGGLGSLVLGPGSQIELVGKGRVRILNGEMALSPAKGQSLEAMGPGAFSEKVGSEKPVAQKPAAEKPLTESYLRVIGGKVQKLGSAPRWLVGYRNSTTSEWMGSLLAKIDGREVPLTVGYHKVDVEIRDQIARTTIEQSFKNETISTLEGVFYFPLPADASISGFGMWIGNELVEADIVEKGRARQIYEDLLRKKKDPGLLEWSGGNLFKARVWPILPHSEKRVRIRYTQVLPLQGSSYRYEYALRSDMLRSNPLRQLALTVRVASSLPIREISSSSHEMRIRKTEHSAKAEFSAEEYRPEKDFVLDVQLERSKPLSLISHQRGKDGYFMLLLTPPDQAANGWKRDMLPEGKPQKLLIVADTSASMGAADRKAQADFIANLLQMLGDKDRFVLMATDVNVSMFQNEELTPSDKNIDQALSWLGGRRSLGWTDLDRCFQKIVHGIKPGTTVVYVGDGIGTSGDGAPQALAARLQRMTQGQAQAKNLVCHAVSTGSTYEKSVLEAIASIGGGSVRAIGSDPAGAAYAILSEATRPSLKNMKLEVQGLRTAALYPATLPNLPVGRQQAVLGRFLPSGKSTKGQAVLTGTLEGKAVRYSTAIDIPTRVQGGEEGNSFLPRLWARRHLDQLLGQGRSPQIKEDIVAFSAEFEIMTPYTSFLVLDTDEQRAEYGLERRVKMRDGEKFFAETKDGVDLEIKQQQMRMAKTWRLRLRAQMLREISRMGKDLTHWHGAYGYVENLAAAGELKFDKRSYRGSGEGGGGRLGAFKGGVDLAKESFNSGWRQPESEASLEAKSGAPRSPARSRKDDSGDDFNAPAEELMDMEEDVLDINGNGQASGFFAAKKSKRENTYGRRARRSLSKSIRNQRHNQAITVDFGFPRLPAVPQQRLDKKAKDWPTEIRDLMKSLKRREALLALPKGKALDLVLRSETLHPLRGKVLSTSRDSLSILGKSWFTISGGWLHPEMRSWRSPDEVGVFNATLGLARTRKSQKLDEQLLRVPFDLVGLENFEESYRLYEAKVEKRDGALWTLRFEDMRFENKTGGDYVLLFVDTQKRMVTGRDLYARGKKYASLRFGKPVQAAGHWWPSKAERLDGEGRLITRWTLEARESDADSWTEKRVFARLYGSSSPLTLKGKLPKLAEARERIFAGKASIEDLYRDFINQVRMSLWDKAWTSFGRFRKAVEATKKGADGLAWIHTQLLAISRKGEAFKNALARFGIAPGIKLQLDSPEAIAWKAQRLLLMASEILGANERASAWDQRKSLFDAEGPGKQNRMQIWMQNRAWIHDSLQEFAKAYALRKKLHEMDPGHNENLLHHLSDLEAQGEIKQAQALCRKSIAMDKTWTLAEADQIWNKLCDLLWNERDLKGLEIASSTWAETGTHNQWARSRWLAAMVYQNRISEADLWAIQRTTLAPSDDPHERAASLAALQFLLGRSWQLGSNLIPEEFHEPIQAMVLRYMRAGPDAWTQVSWIVGDWRIRRLPLVKKIRNALRGDLDEPEKIETLAARHLALYVRLLPWNGNASPEKDYERILTALRGRWSEGSDKAEQHELGNLVLHMLDQRQRKVEALAFVRLRREKEDKAYRQILTEQLSTRLQRQEWSVEIEKELFALLADLEDKSSAPAQRRARMGQRLRALTERLYTMRFQKLLGKAEEYKRLPRKELRAKQKKARLQTRIALASALVEARKSLPDSASAWTLLEALTLSAETGEHLAMVAKSAMTFYTEIPTNENEPDLRTMRERAALIAAYAALKRKAPKELADQVLAFYRMQADKQPKLLDWRYQIARFLIALDRVDELRSTLASWIVPGRIEAQWRVLAAYLDAELGDLDAAVRQLTETAALDQLDASQWLALANWRLALGDKDAYRSAKLEYYTTMTEWQLRRMLYSQMRMMNSRSGNQVPQGFQSETLLVMRALLAKASYPQNEVNRIFQFYKQSKDHRILATLARGIPGLSRDRVYEFLVRSAQQVQQVHEEATCDEVLATIRKMLDGKLATGARRALLLLEAQFAARAALVQNQPGPHIDRAASAMKRAFDGSFDKGEELRLAGYLAALGNLPRSELASLQLSELKQLEERMVRGSMDHLRIALLTAKTHEKYGRLNDAVIHLEAAVKAFREKHGGRLDSQDRSAQIQLVGWYEKLGRFIQAENLLREEMDKAVLVGTKSWYLDRIQQVWINALSNKGRVSIGSGKELFENASAAMLSSLWTYGAAYLDTRFRRYAALHTAAKYRYFQLALGSYRKFARVTVPDILARAPAGSQNLARSVGRTLKQLNGPAEGIAFLVERIEKEPSWFPRAGIDSWNTHGWDIARWRAEARRLDDKLSARLLAIVLVKLENDLTQKGSGNSSIYRRGRYFWSAKRDAFHQIVRKVLEIHEENEDVILRAAQYLWYDLNERAEAITALQRIDAKKLLGHRGLARLGAWLQERNRWKESLPIVDRLIVHSPLVSKYRTMKFAGLNRIGQTEKALAVLAEAEALFKKEKRWTAQLMSEFGRACKIGRLYTPAVRYLRDAIAARRHNRSSGIDSTLAQWYGLLAESHAGLDQVSEAVETASNAIVACGTNAWLRKQKIPILQKVLAGAKDLDAFADQWQARVDKEGVDAPMIRKYLGLTYERRREYQRALRQFLAARELSPGDTFLHQRVVKCYDRLGQAEMATAALLDSIAQQPMKLELYLDLGRRFAKNGNKTEAERAFTSVVERKPAESASHKMLAKVFESEKRYAKSTFQWHQVVRIRADEPGGWFGLARSQSKADQKDAARTTLESMLGKTWPARFTNIKPKIRKALSKL